MLNTTCQKLRLLVSEIASRLPRNIAPVSQSKLRHILADHNLSIQAIVLLPAVNTGVIVWQTVDLPARCFSCFARCPGGNTARGYASVNTNCTVVGIAPFPVNSRSLGWLSCGVCGFYQPLEGNARSALNTPGVVNVVLVDAARLMNCLTD